ncbi:MAG: peptidoglycan recognition family protein [Candidatus Pacebacteria bacterium]|nr:peptidoglycan recognition family protein [Candidatus Paceibacterota bacterium]
MRLNAPDKIIIHHTADSDNRPQFDKINRAHKERTFPLSSLGYYVGYHYLIERDGNITQARKNSDEGAHAVGQNISSIGIGLSGNFDVEWPTVQQKTALTALCTKLFEDLNIPLSEIYNHKDFGDTSCPGKYLDKNTVKWLIVGQEINFINKFKTWLKTFIKI